MSEKGKVVVAMSGGVDSSVVAALLVDQGYDVIGMMLRLWSEPGRAAYNRCCTPESMAAAKMIAAQLDIPFYAVDAKSLFHDTVVQYFIDGYSQGLTPNPCLMCNSQIRWELLLNQALSIGAEFMATGHYARLVRKSEKPIQLMKAIDDNKDQSYVLSILSQDQLEHALFPLGEYTKPEVRELAKRFNLPVAEAKDSQDLCFLAGTDTNSFLIRNAPEVQSPGAIINQDGDIYGEHKGLAFYTIGQRKGLGITAPAPLYVIDKDMLTNTLIVGTRQELGSSELTAGEVNWVSGQPPNKPFRAQIKIRYKSPFHPGLVTPQNGEVGVIFDEPLRDITPGQAAVFYDHDDVLGMGIIQDSDMHSIDQVKLEAVNLHQ